MGEVDTKPITSVQAALTLFGEKNEKDRTTINDELERDEELEGMLKGLSNLKVQIEAKEFANRQSILKIDLYEKQTNELSNLLRNSEIEKEIFMNECNEARTRVHELESKLAEISDQLNKELKTEKEKNEELLGCISKLNEDIVHLKVGANEIDKEMCTILSEKEDELKLKSRKAEENLEDMRGKIEMNNTEIEILTKKNSDQLDFNELMEIELVRLRLELKSAKEENPDFGNTKIELERVKLELEETRIREKEAQVEITNLKSEIHKGQSKIVEAEAIQERLKSENSSLYIAVKQLGIRVEEAKNENKMLRKTETQNEGKNDKNSEELENIKSDLENANAKIKELRARAEQAGSRAEVAEREKSKLEDRITRWRERKERRKRAIAGLREEIIPEESSSYNSFRQGASDSNVHKIYQPLGKVLNMKF